MASPSSVMRVPLPLTPPVFESSVLASRFISCSRKSSFLPSFAAGRQQFAEMLDVRGHARQLLGDVAALDEHGNLFQHSLLVELRSRGRGQPLRQPLLVALLDLRAAARPRSRWLRQAGRACRAESPPALRLRARAWSSTVEQRRNLLQHAGRERGQVVVAAILALQGAGQAQRGVQVRLALQAVLARAPRRRRRDSRRPVRDCIRPSGCAVRSTESVRSTWPRTRFSFSTRRSSISSASRPDGQAQLQIEKAMIHALHGERVTELVLHRLAAREPAPAQIRSSKKSAMLTPVACGTSAAAVERGSCAQRFRLLRLGHVDELQLIEPLIGGRGGQQLFVRSRSR